MHKAGQAEQRLLAVILLGTSNAWTRRLGVRVWIVFILPPYTSNKGIVHKLSHRHSTCAHAFDNDTRVGISVTRKRRYCTSVYTSTHSGSAHLKVQSCIRQLVVVVAHIQIPAARSPKNTQLHNGPNASTNSETESKHLRPHRVTHV